jgi:histidine ammonia-lyase
MVFAQFCRGSVEMTSGTIVIGDEPLTIDALAAIARDRKPAQLSNAAKGRIAASRKVIEDAIASDKPVYGLTTGLGAGVDTRLSPDDLAAFQRRVAFARAVGVGGDMPSDEVRAMMVARVASMSVGQTGVSVAVPQALVDALNAGFHPIVPSIGSVGAADLAPLAHMALALLGDGEAEVGGERLGGTLALERAGLQPVPIGPKDGHALVVANAASAGRGALALVDVRRALDALDRSAALAMEAFGANISPLAEAVNAARPAPGQLEAAKALYKLFEGGPLGENKASRRVQDPLSYRCVAPVHGAARTAFAEAEAMVMLELNHSGDNPVIVNGQLKSNGNFDMTGFTLRFESLSQALSHAATISAQRALKLMSHNYSDQPRFLTPMGQSRTGFATLQKAISALEGEVRARAQPATLALLHAADGVEDHAANAPAAVAKLAESAEFVLALAACEMIVAAQAIDLNGQVKLGRGTTRIHDFVRGHVDKLEEDRPSGPDVSRLAEAIRAGGW